LVSDCGTCPTFGYDCEYVAKVEAQAAEIAEYRRQHCSAVEIARPLLDALETQATAVKRLREALRGMVEYSRFNERWQEAHPEYVAAARAALGETK
jgi:hypothetical protein